MSLRYTFGRFVLKFHKNRMGDDFSKQLSIDILNSINLQTSYLEPIHNNITSINNTNESDLDGR